MKLTRCSCKKIQLHLCTNLDEHLKLKKCVAIKRHLEKCSECRKYLKSLKKIIQLYQNYPLTPVKCRDKSIYFMGKRVKL